MKRVLITGPTGNIEHYAQAARNAGWEAIEQPLLRIETSSSALSEVSAEPFDWIAVTSSNALVAIGEQADRLQETPCAAVGPNTADGLRRLGFSVAIEASGTAAELAAEILAKTSEEARILWPRGNLARDLGRALRAAGRVVVDVEVYTTRVELERELPSCEAIFLASPSAVKALREAPVLAVVIGPTTAQALHERFAHARSVVLDEPGPRALERALAALA